MKVRRGFVSNSSSCSFCMFGIEIQAEELNEALKVNGLMEETCSEIDDWFYNTEGSNFLEKYGLIAETPFLYDDGIVYLGRYWKNIPDIQSGLEFKAGVQGTLTKILGEIPECTTHEVAWENR